MSEGGIVWPFSIHDRRQGKHPCCAHPTVWLHSFQSEPSRNKIEFLLLSRCPSIFLASLQSNRQWLGFVINNRIFLPSIASAQQQHLTIKLIPPHTKNRSKTESQNGKSTKTGSATSTTFSILFLTPFPLVVIN